MESLSDKEGRRNFSDNERKIGKTLKEGTKEMNNRGSAESREVEDKRFGHIYTSSSNRKLI